jgi:hypothetical protein
VVFGVFGGEQHEVKIEEDDQEEDQVGVVASAIGHSHFNDTLGAEEASGSEEEGGNEEEVLALDDARGKEEDANQLVEAQGEEVEEKDEEEEEEEEYDEQEEENEDDEEEEDHHDDDPSHPPHDDDDEEEEEEEEEDDHDDDPSHPPHEEEEEDEDTIVGDEDSGPSDDVVSPQHSQDVNEADECTMPLDEASPLPTYLPIDLIIVLIVLSSIVALVCGAIFANYVMHWAFDVHEDKQEEGARQATVDATSVAQAHKARDEAVRAKEVWTEKVNMDSINSLFFSIFLLCQTPRDYFLFYMHTEHGEAA